MDWERVIENLHEKGDIPHDVTFTVTGTGLFIPDDEGSHDTTDTKISAHKFILSMVSEVFNKMFNGSLPEKSEIIISDCSYKAFKAMIDLVYNRAPKTESDVR